MIEKTKGIRTFEMIQYVTAPLEGEFDDWPANIQDAIYAAAERKSKDVELPLTIVHTRCDKDIDTEDPNKVFFIHVILSEIVIGIDATQRRH